jgi:hypothetical protein
MYAQNDRTAPSPQSSAARPTRAILQTRLLIQRACIRYWEYIKPVRVIVLAIRLLVVAWLIVLSSVLTSSGYAADWILLPIAAAVAAFSVWVFNTAAKGWPVAGA